VAAGTYRERISPARGGLGPSQMISYEAAPGAKVVLKGSCIFQEAWSSIETAVPARIWKTQLPSKYFAGYKRLKPRT